MSKIVVKYSISGTVNQTTMNLDELEILTAMAAKKDELTIISTRALKIRRGR